MKNPKTFEQIREMIATSLDPYQKIHSSFLNEKGKLIYRVYDELDECFCFASNLKEYVDAVQLSIAVLEARDGYVCPTTTTNAEKMKVAEMLRRFVRFNIAEELWENNPEFASKGW